MLYLDCVLGVFAVLVLSNWLDIILLSAVKIQVKKGRINGGKMAEYDNLPHSAVFPPFF